MIEGRDIVCNSFVTWDEHWGTPQQLMSRLAPRNRVLYVEQPVSVLSFFTGIRSRGAVARQLKRWRQGPRRVADNVWAAAPPPVLPMRANAIVNRINATIMRRWLGAQVRRLGLRDVIYWNLQPAMPAIGRAVSPALRLFHCVDDFSALPHWWHQSASTLAREEECCREADLVVCTARRLVETRRGYNSNIHFVPNAGNPELFLRATARETVVPPDIAKLPGPVVGIFGVIDFRTDVEVIARIARQRPDWSLALVGLVKGDVDLEPLQALGNVHIFGKKPTEDLAGYLKAMDCCLIAYAMIDYNHHVFPLKLYDYMAAGKPIVASDMEELRPLGGEHLTIARSLDEWVPAIEAAMAADSKERVAERQSVAAGQSWDHRVEEISAILEPMLIEGRGAQNASSEERREALAGEWP